MRKFPCFLVYYVRNSRQFLLYNFYFFAHQEVGHFANSIKHWFLYHCCSCCGKVVKLAKQSFVVGQIGNFLNREALQKFVRRAVEQRFATCFLSANNVYHAKLGQVLHGVCTVYTTDFLHFQPCDWLLVGNDSKCFQHGVGQLLFLDGVEHCFHFLDVVAVACKLQFIK